MFTPRQHRQHGARIRLINRFAENFPIEHHGGIGTEHTKWFIRHDAAAPGLGLAACQALDVGRWGFLS
ncbi:hypothetical protein D3C75_358520 [compost metagenome]